jgi:hypothetical protein
MPTPELSPTVPLPARLSTYVANALGYWEPRRLLYNLVLTAVVVAEAAANWATVARGITVDLVLALFILAVLANVAYCAVYAVDLFVQFSGLNAYWARGRTLVLVVGTAFGAALTHFFLIGPLSV